MLDVRELPYITKEMPGIGGQIKTFPEDFVVEELPLYEACGEGTHIYFQIEKSGISTMRAVEDIARGLGRPVRDIGFAGLKDANAVTIQTLSIEHVDPSRIEQLSIPRIRVLNVNRHGNKLKLGHLSGNRFRIKVRRVDRGRVTDAGAMMELLFQCGVPNYFGPQRFGMRGDTWEIGRAMLREDYREALAVMLGRPGPKDFGKVLEARELFDKQDYEAAAVAWPGLFRDEIRVCRKLAQSKDHAQRAFGAINKRLRRLFVSAYQSQLFNQVVAMRIDSLGRLFEGDLAWLHSNGAVFKVEDSEKEQPRCDAFEISPTGPLFGYKMTQASGEPGNIEATVLEEEHMNPDDWRSVGINRVRGGRRPLRFQPIDSLVEADTDKSGDFIVLSFTLESGCYATTVLREICKAEDCSTIQ
ncbi:MAG: tRNA pseudouridine(13) synthase TruD [Planctomycetota bacterium]|jgi:tRNA pseudouridine13 synthase